MGASLTMIDRHYGHPARDGRDHAIDLLDACTGSESVDVHAVDAALDVGSVSRRPIGQRKGQLSRKKPEPSDGLEPSTPSLPSRSGAREPRQWAASCRVSRLRATWVRPAAEHQLTGLSPSRRRQSGAERSRRKISVGG